MNRLLICLFNCWIVFGLFVWKVDVSVAAESSQNMHDDFLRELTSEAIAGASADKVGVAGAIVMYDRVISLGRHARRPVNPRAAPERPARHVQGGQIIRRR